MGETKRGERVQKLIARTGLCSRREADRLVAEGRVTVNGDVVEPGARADPDVDHVKVDGRHLKAAEPTRHVVMYKPAKVMTTLDDPEGRPTVAEIVRPVFSERLFPVGRLDYHSEGLLLLTNDGDLAHRVGHPRHGVVREYLAKVKGDLDETEVAKLRGGTTIDGRRVTPIDVVRERVTGEAGNSWWRVKVGEGRTHEVRELFFRVGHPVQRLKRVAIGPLRDDELGPGDFRELTATEVRTLREATSRGPRRRRPRRAGPKSR